MKASQRASLCAVILHTLLGPSPMPRRQTWRRHDFIDASNHSVRERYARTIACTVPGALPRSYCESIAAAMLVSLDDL